jgi:outer membrane biosynthesis protein TonB
VAAKATSVASTAASVAKPVAIGAKLLLIGSVGVAAVGGGAFQAGRVVERRQQEVRIAEAAKVPKPPPVVATPTPPPPPPQVEPEPEPEPVLPPVKAVVKPKPVETVSPEQEAELLTRALGASKQSQWSEALAAAEQHARKFPNGSLAQEREMIAIESLLKLGRRAEAERRADRFRKAWPTSTHLVRLNSLMKE